VIFASLLLIAQSSGSYVPYKERIKAIDAKYAKIISPQVCGDLIAKEVRTWYKNINNTSDEDLVAAVYKCYYKNYFLCFQFDHEMRGWSREIIKFAHLIKPSIEKQICLAYLDPNDEGWLVPKYAEWKVSAILASILTRKSSMWCSKPSRYPIYTEVYNKAASLRSRSKILGEGLDISFVNAQFQVFHEKKYMRLYIDRTKKYVSHTPDPIAHQALLDDAILMESLHFPKN